MERRPRASSRRPPCKPGRSTPPANSSPTAKLRCSQPPSAVAGAACSFGPVASGRSISPRWRVPTRRRPPSSSRRGPVAAADRRSRRQGGMRYERSATMHPVAARVSSPAFIGRAGPLQRLDAAAARAAAGDSTAVVVGGEAGVGKTRLVREFATRVPGWRVLTGTCIDLGDAGPPFGPMVEILRTLVREEGAERHPRPGGTRGGGTRAARSRARDAGRRARPWTRPAARPACSRSCWACSNAWRSTNPFSSSSRTCTGPTGRPAICSRISSTSSEPHGSRSSPTFRADELSRRHPLRPWLAELERSGRAERVDLERFDRDDVAAQLHGILGEDPTPDVVDTIFARSDGNAFFTEELVAAGGSLNSARTVVDRTSAVTARRLVGARRGVFRRDPGALATRGRGRSDGAPRSPRGGRRTATTRSSASSCGRRSRSSCSSRPVSRSTRSGTRCCRKRCTTSCSRANESTCTPRTRAR